MSTELQLNSDNVESDELALKIDTLLADIEQWEAEPRSKALELKSAIEAFHSSALRNLIKSLSQQPSAKDALRSAIQDPLVYGMLRRHNLVKPSLQEQVLNALDIVRPELQQHGGDVELVAISSSSEVTIRLTGACDGCGSSQITLEQGVKKTLREHCGWIKDIHLEQKPKPTDDVQTIQIISPFETSSHSE